MAFRQHNQVGLERVSKPATVLEGDVLHKLVLIVLRSSHVVQPTKRPVP